MLNVNNADTDMRRSLDEKEKNLQEALKQIQILERDMAEKDAKKHMLLSTSRSSKALEAMVGEVRPEGHSSHSMNYSANKSSKFYAKPRGFGSPFKCMGLGMVQQIKYEKDEELTAARLKIGELESLATSRQREIFTLNTKLVAAISMTHDVIRDLLGLKLDMTAYMSILDNQQVQKITEKAPLHNLISQDKEQEIDMLKNQLSSFMRDKDG